MKSARCAAPCAASGQKQGFSNVGLDIFCCLSPPQKSCFAEVLEGELGRPQTIPIRVDLPNVGMILTFGFP